MNEFVNLEKGPWAPVMWEEMDYIELDFRPSPEETAAERSAAGYPEEGPDTTDTGEVIPPHAFTD